MSDPEVKHILNMFEPTTLDRKKAKEGTMVNFEESSSN